VQKLVAVDNNVTRHINTELSSSDWDFLILHYLGLDHVGHLGGPKRYYLPPYSWLSWSELTLRLPGFCLAKKKQKKLN
jgi:predicted AlkP superfamily pyrophosphatase or phosphodiesterase